MAGDKCPVYCWHPGEGCHAVTPEDRVGRAYTILPYIRTLFILSCHRCSLPDGDVNHCPFAHWAELEPECDRPVAVVCKMDKQSRQAIQWLGKRGFTQVYLAIGDIEAWQAVQLPVLY